jgi:hypothetical protein
VIGNVTSNKNKCASQTNDLLISFNSTVASENKDDILVFSSFSFASVILIIYFVSRILVLGKLCRSRVLQIARHRFNHAICVVVFGGVEKAAQQTIQKRVPDRRVQLRE